MAGRGSSIIEAPVSAPATTATAVNSTPTTTTQNPPKISSHITQSQLALALAFQKSKPAGITTKDYCAQLRANIQIGTGIQSSPRHIDTPEFWKGQYSRVHTEKMALEDKVHRLEEELRLRGDGSQVTIQDGGLVTLGKRPASTNIETLMDLEEDPSASLDQDVMLRLSSHVLRISRSRITLENAINESTRQDHIEYQFKSSIELLALLESALSECSTSLSSLRCCDDARTLQLLQQLMHQYVVSFRSCFEALNTLCRTILGRQKRFEIVYGLVNFFSKSLDHLRTICNIQAESEIAARKLRHKRQNIESEYAINKYMTGMLIHVSQMDWKVGQAAHSEILEGILFSILDHTGRLLSNAIFKEHVSTSDRVGNITKSGTEMLPEAANLEARCIVPVLHACLGTSTDRKELIARVLAERPTDRSVIRQSTRHTNELVLKARKMIQSSLVKSAVGGEALQSLRTPLCPEEGQYTLKAVGPVDRYGPEWLLESVWALVGWELPME